MPKRLLAFVLSLLIFSLTLVSCDIESLFGGNQNRNDEIVGDGTSYTDFMNVMREIKKYGDITSEKGLTSFSEYYYSFAGASVSALRYAVETILWLKGEGGSFDDFVSDSRYAGWDRIAEINYSSPYPSYFEGLLLEVQGKSEECLDPYAVSSIMPMFPEEGLDFYYLKKMDVSALYELRDELREIEDSIYSAYSPSLTGRDWDRLYFDPEYLIALSYESVEAADYDSAFFYARQALKDDPFEPVVWHNAVMCALCAGEFALAGQWVDEGLAAFPDDEQLTDFRQMFFNILNDKEGQS